MLAMAKKDALYENYICEFVTDKQLPVATGESYSFSISLVIRGVGTGTMASSYSKISPIDEEVMLM